MPKGTSIGTDGSGGPPLKGMPKFSHGGLRHMHQLTDLPSSGRYTGAYTFLVFFNCCGQSRSPLKNGDLSSFEKVLNPLIYRTFVKPRVARNS